MVPAAHNYKFTPLRNYKFTPLRNYKFSVLETAADVASQMLAAIGETFETPLAAPGEKPAAPEASDLVTGVIVSSRPGL
jgi:hypothetical protein